MEEQKNMAFIITQDTETAVAMLNLGFNLVNHNDLSGIWTFENDKKINFSQDIVSKTIYSNKFVI